jgi:hypothetical protein
MPRTRWLTPLLLVLLPTVAGVICAFWEAHVNAGCGYASWYTAKYHIKTFPGQLAFLVLAVPSILLVCASAIFEHRSTRAIVAFALVTAVASWLALLAAGFNYAASYGCFS